MLFVDLEISVFDANISEFDANVILITPRRFKKLYRRGQVKLREPKPNET